MVPKTAPETQAQSGRLVKLGFFLTATWLGLGFTYAFGVGWDSLQSADALGSFLEGAFAPLAFLWLVIGYFLQQSELARNTDALEMQLAEIRRQSEHSVVQAEAIAASEFHARQQAFLDLTKIVYEHLGAIAGLLYISVYGAAPGGHVANEEIAELFGQKNLNDHEIFSRRLLTAYLSAGSERDQFNLFYGTEIRARHANNFVFTFERLVQKAHECDPDDLIADAIKGSGHGFLYKVIKSVQEKAPPELRDIERTGRDIRFGVSA